MRYRFVKAAVAALLLCSGLLAATPGLQPYLQNMGPDRVTILWTTLGGGGRGEVRYSTGASLGRVASSTVRFFSRDETNLPDDFWLHRADLAGLEPGVSYRYRVYVDGADFTPAGSAPEPRFTTAPGTSPLRFLVFGDSGDGAPAQAGLVPRMTADAPAFVLHAGDLAYEDGTFQQLQDYFFRVYQAIGSRAPFFPVLGNHDYGFRSAAAYLAMFALPIAEVPAEGRGRYYSFDWGPIHVTALDSNQPLMDAAAGAGPMLAWLERDLQTTQQQWRIAIFHHTPFPNTHHVGDPNCEAAFRFISPILERYGVHLVLSGHEHIYQRTFPQRNTVYLTTGGGGYALHPASPRKFAAVALSVSHYLRVSVSGTGMRVEAVGLQGEIVDDFTISSSAQIDAAGVANAANFDSGVAPGGLFSIFGKDLIRSAGNPGLSVLLGGQVVPLLYVSRNQVNGQIPFGLLGDSTLELTGPNGTLKRAVSIREAAPAVFAVPREDGTQAAAITHLDGTLVTSQAPCSGGEPLSIYLTGLGAVAPVLPTGLAAPSGVLYRTVLPVRVTVDEAPADVLFAGLSPGLIGVNQINFIVPPVPAGQRTLKIVAGAAASLPVPLPCR